MHFSTTVFVLTALAAASAVVASKRGILYTDPNTTALFGDKISWAYNKASSPGGAVPVGIQFLPMLLDADAAHTVDWVANVEAAIAAGTPQLLGFDVPDPDAEGYMTPREAAVAWRTWLEPFAGRAQLVGPAVTGGGMTGMAWAAEFVSECLGCTLDFLALHWYGADTDAFISYVEDVARTTSKDIWLTELTVSGTAEEQMTFFAHILPALDASPDIARYAYPGWLLVDSSGSLTPLGVMYNTA